MKLAFTLEGKRTVNDFLSTLTEFQKQLADSDEITSYSPLTKEDILQDILLFEEGDTFHKWYPVTEGSCYGAFLDLERGFDYDDF